MATFCLLHGNWHDSSCWTPLVERLRVRGHNTVAPDLPFDDPAADYAARAQPALDALVDVDDPIVIVAHSVASAEGALVAAKRRPALLIYLCPRFGSFAVPEDAPEVFRPDFPWPARDERGRLVWDRDAAIATMYPRLRPDVANDLTDRLRPAAPANGAYPLREHPNVPTALVYTTDDEFFTPDWERFVAQRLLGVEPVELPGGHFPMAEDPDRLAATLDDLTAPANGRSRPRAH